MGRERQEPGGPRPIDMDIITWGDEVMDSEFLTVPHPRAKERAFVLIPLKEIDPEFVFPDGTTIDQALESIEYRIEGNKIWQDS